MHMQCSLLQVPRTGPGKTKIERKRRKDEEAKKKQKKRQGSAEAERTKNTPFFRIKGRATLLFLFYFISY